MTPAELSRLLRALLVETVVAGEISLDLTEIPESIHLERARGQNQADWATNIALQLAKRAGLKPLDLAQRLADRLAPTPGIATVEVAGPGFINITLEAGAAGQLARDIVEAGPAYGQSKTLSGEHFNVEFVSANPTGPIHLGGARWAAVGDALSRIFEACGAAVTREYYFNDHGSQIDRFAASLLARSRGDEPPAGGYGGQYISEIAAAVTKQAEADGFDLLSDSEKDAFEYFRSHGVEQMFDEIKISLQAFGVNFDVYFHEASLHDSGAVETALTELRTNGSLFAADGAWWLKSTDFGDDKDRVVIKSDGSAAYIAGDIAYLRDKLNRGATRAIYLLGADHHGYIARLKAAASALGENPDKVEVLIGQLVSLTQDGQEVKMSKRAGTVVTMEDLVEAVGVDAARYGLVRSSIDSPITLDLGLLSSRTNENPVFYVQYAHARTANVARNAAAAGVNRVDGFDPTLLDDPTEANLIGQLASFQRVLEQAADLREPHRISRYLEELAAAYHKWYDARRVVPWADEPVGPVHRTRLWLNDATGQVLANGLGLLGVSAPERM